MAIHENPETTGRASLSLRDVTKTYVMGAEKDWWNYGLNTIKVGPWPIADRNMLADNVVRFDVYCLGWDGKDWMAEDAGKQGFNSLVGPARIPNGAQYRNTPPAAFDVYLQITSPAVAVESGMALVPGVPADIQEKAREKMIRESASLFGRASPIIGSAQLHHPVQHYN